MNFKQIEAFYWLTRLQSFQKVADRIGLTQPAVSARISGLEDAFGVPLINRDSPTFALTEQGHEVAEYAETFLSLSEALTGRLRAGRKKRYTIGMVGMVTNTWGATLRRKVSADPDIGLVDFHSASNVDLKELMRNGTLDMAFVTGEAGLPQIANSFSVQFRVGWVARPDVAGQISRALTPDEIRGYPLILYPHTSPLFRPVADMVEELRRRPNARHTGNSLGNICDMVRAGYGVSAIPLAAVEMELTTGLLTEIPATVQLAPLVTRCVHMNRARKQQSESLLELARQAAREWAAAHPRYVTFMET
ncbi:LysR family transcriptional regulator [Falsirhodobacter halotolerans]|uniref:LysR family transcriptional regulator n=1 Tax=Falsirhodobacter halotolerans TaxID=1146892 RepID=UPI001FD5BAA6|nr:LysR family transcriptional regulator [Falsirhodobacter halotolerans]MCJ8139042.1 LysR family transcriptional regulator [Falsirhodobacter halotolerans]